MARVSLDLENRGLLGRIVGWYSRRKFGKVLEPAAAMAHHRGVMMVTMRHEMAVRRKWTKLDPTLSQLAQGAAAAAVGCQWCMDFGYWHSINEGTDPRKVEDIPRWRDSDAYTELERWVLEYAEAMSATPPAVTDELSAKLRDALGEARLVELTGYVALENFRGRFNDALGLRSQGLKAECAVPARGTGTA